MHRYRVEYYYDNGARFVEYINAANRYAAYEMFMSFDYEGVVDVEIFLDEEEVEEEIVEIKEEVEEFDLAPTIPYGYQMWGGQLRDALPHGRRWYMNGGRW